MDKKGSPTGSKSSPMGLGFAAVAIFRICCRRHFCSVFLRFFRMKLRRKRKPMLPALLASNFFLWFHLKKGKEDWNAMEEIEEELIRRKKFKRESWFDAEGNVICVAISPEFGNQTFIMDEEGFPKPACP